MPSQTDRITIASPWITFATSCANLSWSDRMTSSCPASGGIRSATLPPMPTRSLRVRDELAQVERNVAARGRDGVAAVLDHVEELFVRGPIGGCPRVLDRRALERPVGGTRGELAPG